MKTFQELAKDAKQFVKTMCADIFPPNEDGWEVPASYAAANQPCCFMVHICRSRDGDFAEVVVPVDMREMSNESAWPSVRRRVTIAVGRIKAFYKEESK